VENPWKKLELRWIFNFKMDPIQWVPEARFLELKLPGHDADHSPPPNAEVKNAWSYTPIRLHGVVLS